MSDSESQPLAEIVNQVRAEIDPDDAVLAFRLIALVNRAFEIGTSQGFNAGYEKAMAVMRAEIDRQPR